MISLQASSKNYAFTKSLLDLSQMQRKKISATPNRCILQAKILKITIQILIDRQLIGIVKWSGAVFLHSVRGQSVFFLIWP